MLPIKILVQNLGRPPQIECPQLDLAELARDAINNGHRIITTPEELAALGPSSPKGIPKSFKEDMRHSPLLLAELAFHYTKKAASKALGLRIVEESDPYEPAFLMGPGYFGPNDYLRTLGNSLRWQKITHPAFEDVRLLGSIQKDARLYAEMLKKRRAPTVAVFHSRGGPIIIKALELLQREQQDDKLTAIILIAPITLGVRDEISKVIRFIPSFTIQEMRGGSGILDAWQKLSPQNRAKVITIAAQDGDVFTSKERAFFQGSTMIVTKECDGHLQQCLDPNSEMFQTVSIIGNRTAQEVEFQMAA